MLADAPRGYWRLGELSGSTAANEVAGGAAGAYQNGVALGLSGGLVGDVNKSIGLDGTNDQVSMGDPANGSFDFGTADFSVESWVKTSANNERVIIAKRSSDSSTPYWQVTISDDGGHLGHVRANAFDGVDSVAAYGPAIRVDNNAWHHVAVVFDRDQGITVWVDGTSQTTSGAFPRTISNTAALLVGKSPNPSFPYFQGQVDEVALYAGVLTGARVGAHRNAGLGLPPPPAQPTYLPTVLADSPRALWRLSEASGTVAANSIAGGASGTYQNGVLLGQAGVLANDTNKSVFLDGSNDQVNMGDPATGSLDFGTGDFSVETWVRPWANDDRVIISKRGASGPYWQVLIADQGNEKGEVRAEAFDGAVFRAAPGPDIRVDNGAWHHVVVLYDRDSGITVWVDGVSRTTTGAFTGNINNTGSLLLGKSPPGSFPYFLGMLDEVALYPSLLPAARVNAHRAAALGL